MTEAFRTWADSDFYLSITDSIGNQFPKLQRIAQLVRAPSDALTVDTSGSKLNDILKGVSFGTQAQRHKWRTYYDSVNDFFLIQRNSGTDASKNWVTMLRVNAAGNLVVTGNVSNSLVSTSSGEVILSGVLNANDFYVRNVSKYVGEWKTEALRVYGTTVLSGTTTLPEASVETWAGWVPLETRTVDGAEAYTSLISSTYAQYVMILDHVTVSTNNTDLTLEVSTNNGSSYLAANYQYSTFSHRNDATTRNTGSTSAAIITMTGGASGWRLGTGLGSDASGWIHIRALGNSLQFAFVSWEIDLYTDVGGLVKVSGTAIVPTTPNSMNAFRLSASSGNTNGGTTRLYGIRKNA